jgi:hypothetical protein
VVAVKRWVHGKNDGVGAEVKRELTPFQVVKNFDIVSGKF